MTKLKFDYVKIGQHKRPIIPIQIRAGGNAVNTQALIDSGADFNLINLEIADALGIKLNRKRPTIFNGVGNKSLNLKGYIAIVDLKIFDRGQSIDFSAPIVFTDQLPINGHAILGESGFFDKFGTVSFYYARGKVILENNKT